MIALIPAPLHRALLRLAHAARLAFWRRTGATVLGCNVLACDPQGHVLLVRHSYHDSDRWTLPGGGLKRGEDPVAAGARELEEETGCVLTGGVRIGTDTRPRGGWTNVVELIAGTTASVPRPDGREIIEARFFALDALPALMVRGTAERIAMLRERQRGQTAAQ